MTKGITVITVLSAKFTNSNRMHRLAVVDKPAYDPYRITSAFFSAHRV